MWVPATIEFTYHQGEEGQPPSATMTVNTKDGEELFEMIGEVLVHGDTFSFGPIAVQVTMESSGKLSHGGNTKPALVTDPKSSSTSGPLKAGPVAAPAKK